MASHGLRRRLHSPAASGLVCTLEGTSLVWLLDRINGCFGSRSRSRQHRHWLQVRGEVAEEWSFVGKVHAGNSVAVLPDFENDFDDIVDVALGVDAARDGEADEIHLRGARQTSACRFRRSGFRLPDKVRQPARRRETDRAGMCGRKARASR